MKIVKSTINIRRFNANAIVEDFHNQVEEVLKRAAVKFVQKAASRVPSLTGQAKAALINLAVNLGVDPGITPDTPPVSEYTEQFQLKLNRLGNTVERGRTLSTSSIEKNNTQVILNLKYKIFAAHNGFDYFTWWDEKTWHSIEEAKTSFRNFIRVELKKITLRKNNG